MRRKIPWDMSKLSGYQTIRKIEIVKNYETKE